MKYFANIRVEIDYDFLEQILVTCFEGGSNYWLKIQDEDYETLKKSKYSGEPIAVIVSKLMLENPEFSIRILDVEDDEYLGTISLNSLITCLTENDNTLLHNCVMKIKNEDYDAETADIIMQYWTMNDIVYG